MRQTAAAVRRSLRQHVNPEKAAFYPTFFRSGKGEYGEGDRFLGVVVPDQRRVARQFGELPLSEVEKLLEDAYHECRLTGVYILVLKFERGDESEQAELVEFFLDNLKGINNWDIVDSSAPKILGQWLLDRPRGVLDGLADSGQLWHERIAVVACLPLIKNGEFREIKRLARRFLTHKHDLIHKATGWMLREMGKQDERALCSFLDQHAKRMPRTMLRYALERLKPTQRRRYMEK